jgi:hypothetical protein
LLKKSDSHSKLNFTNPLKASLSIHNFEGKKLSKKTCITDINSISINTIQFTSHLDFPTDKGILLQFKLQLLGQTHNLYGAVWKKRKKSNQFLYDIALKQTQLGYIKSLLLLTGEIHPQASMRIS